MKPVKRITLSLPAVLLAALIFIISSGPLPEMPNIGIVWEDKIIHVIAYYVFGISLILFLIANINYSNFKIIVILTLIIGSLYAFSDELHQYYVPGRSPEILDWIADLLGIIIAVIFVNIFKSKLMRVNS
jgi:VanZ family protein